MQFLVFLLNCVYFAEHLNSKEGKQYLNVTRFFILCETSEFPLVMDFSMFLMVGVLGSEACLSTRMGLGLSAEA